MKEHSKSSQKQIRRRAIIRNAGVMGSVAASGMMLPQHWAKPFVASVTLPAHGNTSVSCGDFPGTYFCNVPTLPLQNCINGFENVTVNPTTLQITIDEDCNVSLTGSIVDPDPPMNGQGVLLSQSGNSFVFDARGGADFFGSQCPDAGTFGCGGRVQVHGTVSEIGVDVSFVYDQSCTGDCSCETITEVGQCLATLV